MHCDTYDSDAQAWCTRMFTGALQGEAQRIHRRAGSQYVWRHRAGRKPEVFASSREDQERGDSPKVVLFQAL
jgi:hypothetical protein